METGSLIPTDELHRITFESSRGLALKNTTTAAPSRTRPVDEGAHLLPFAHDLVLDFASTSSSRRTSEPARPRTCSSSASHRPITSATTTVPIRWKWPTTSCASIVRWRTSSTRWRAVSRSRARGAHRRSRRAAEPRDRQTAPAGFGRRPHGPRTPDPNATLIRDLPPTRIEIERNLQPVGYRLQRECAARACARLFLRGAGSLAQLETRFRAASRRRARETRPARRAAGDEASRHRRRLDQYGNARRRSAGSKNRQLMRHSFAPTAPATCSWPCGRVDLCGGPTAPARQPVENDMHVPLMFWGSGVKPGIYEGERLPARSGRTSARFFGSTPADEHPTRSVFLNGARLRVPSIARLGWSRQRPRTFSDTVCRRRCSFAIHRRSDCDWPCGRLRPRDDPRPGPTELPCGPDSPRRGASRRVKATPMTDPCAPQAWQRLFDVPQHHGLVGAGRGQPLPAGLKVTAVTASRAPPAWPPLAAVPARLSNVPHDHGLVLTR